MASGWCWFIVREKYRWLVAGGWFVLREKYCWLVADKPSEQGEACVHPYLTPALPAPVMPMPCMFLPTKNSSLVMRNFPLLRFFSLSKDKI
jgi:hypothetical protein